MIHLIDAGLSLSTFTLIFSYVFSLNLFQKSTRIPIGYVTELNINDIATTIKNFLDHPQESKEMGDSYGALRYRTRQFILDNYTWDHIASKMISVYENIIQGNKHL